MTIFKQEDQLINGIFSIIREKQQSGESIYLAANIKNEEHEVRGVSRGHSYDLSGYAKNGKIVFNVSPDAISKDGLNMYCEGDERGIWFTARFNLINVEVVVPLECITDLYTPAKVLFNSTTVIEKDKEPITHIYVDGDLGRHFDITEQEYSVMIEPSQDSSDVSVDVQSHIEQSTDLSVKTEGNVVAVDFKKRKVVR